MRYPRINCVLVYYSAIIIIQTSIGSSSLRFLHITIEVFLLINNLFQGQVQIVLSHPHYGWSLLYFMVNDARYGLLVLYLFFFFFLSVLGFEHRASHTCEAEAVLLESLYQPFFVLGIFELGSHELFAWTSFELRSSWSLPPE
jgi:hypothetical protein